MEKTTSWIKIIYHRNSWESLVITCFTTNFVNPNLFRKHYNCEPHKILNKHSISNIFISNNERNETPLNILHITVHFSSELLCYIFTLLQSSYQIYVMVNYDVTWSKNTIKILTKVIGLSAAFWGRISSADKNSRT